MFCEMQIAEIEHLSLSNPQFEGSYRKPDWFYITWRWSLGVEIFISSSELLLGKSGTLENLYFHELGFFLLSVSH